MLRTSFRTLQTQRPLLLRCGVALAVTLGAMGVCGMTGEAPRSTMASDSGEFSGVDWKAKLTAAQYDVTRNGGTERPWSSKLNNVKDNGTFRCVCCGESLFKTGAKFDSGTGWPSFWEPASPTAVEERTDRSLGMARTEVLCNKCKAHLGHVFNDGPRDKTGLRYCINGVALKFEKE